MELQIEFESDPARVREILLQVLNVFQPTTVKISYFPGFRSMTLKIVLTGALPLNPFKALDEIQVDQTQQSKKFVYTIQFLRFEETAEKAHLPMWILTEKL